MTTSFRRRLIGAVAVLGMLGAVAPAWAQTGEYRQQLDAQLEGARQMAAEANLEVFAGPFFGGLEEGSSETYTLTVTKDKTYLIGGVCDNDCSDLDIRVYNLSGALIGEDTLDDDAPVVPLVPTVSGRVKIEVAMHACSEAPCFFAVEVYED